MKIMRLFILLAMVSACLLAAQVKQPDDAGRDIRNHSASQIDISKLALIQSHESPDSSEKKREAKKPDNDNPSVVINQIPPITLNKDGWDYFATILNCLLVLVTAGTFGAVIYQAIQTRKAAEAAKASACSASKSAAEMEKSVKLQEAQLEQWIDTTDEWKCKLGTTLEDETATVGKSILISFGVANETKMALTLQKIIADIGGTEAFVWQGEHLLTPEGTPYLIETGRKMDGRDLADFSNHKLDLPISVTIEFTAATGAVFIQIIDYMGTFGMGNRVSLHELRNTKTKRE